jgi:hypothetical protein
MLFGFLRCYLRMHRMKRFWILPARTTEWCLPRTWIFRHCWLLEGTAAPSLVTLRLMRSDPETVTQTLLNVLPGLEEVMKEGAVAVIEEGIVRIRYLPVR